MSRIDLDKRISRYWNMMLKSTIPKLSKVYKYISLYIKKLIKFLKPKVRIAIKYIKKHKNELIIVIVALPVAIIWGLLLYRWITTPRPARLQSLDENSSYYYQGKTRLYQLSIGDRDTNEPKVEIALSDSLDKSITFYPASARTGIFAPTEKNNKITFTDVYTDADFTYQPVGNGVKEEIIVKKPNLINTYPFYLDLKGVTPKYFVTDIAGGVFYDEDGNYLFNFEKPFAIDAKGKRTNDVNIAIKKDPATEKLVALLVVNKDWLSSQDRAYPVTIDPTIVHDTTAEFATGQMDRVKDTGSGSAPNLESYYQELPADTNTIGLWHFNEASGNALDSSGNGNTGVPTGTTIVDGLLGKARSLPGGTTTDYISVSSFDDFPSKAITAEFWVNTTVSGGAILSYASTNALNNDFLIFPTNSINIYIGNSAVTTGVAVNDGNWHHLAVTWQSTDGTVILYKDGVVVFTGTVLSGGSIGSGGTLVFGQESDTVGGGFDSAQAYGGIIDEVRISNIVRTPEEIKLDASRRPYSTYTSDVIDLSQDVISWNSLSWNGNGFSTGDGETATASATSNLVAQWNFNETSGTTAVSGGTCGTSCNGTLTNFASTGSQDSATGTGWTSDNRRWGAGALMFDGTDDYIVISSDTPLPSGTSDRSIEFWINPKTTASGDRILSYGAWSANNAFDVIFYDTSGTLGVVSHTNNYQSSGKAIPGQWNHIIITLNNQVLKFYVNGILQSTHTTTINTTLNSGEWRIGNQLASRGANDTFSGILDSTKIYSRALTTSEILSNYNSSRLELQTRVGDSTDPNDGTWEAWRPTTAETQIASLDSDANNWFVNQKSISPTSCKDILDAGNSTGDGVYTIYPLGDTLSVYCDMTTDGGGWTLVLNNGNSATTPPKPTWTQVINNNNTTGTFGSNLTIFDQFLGVKYWNALGPQMRLTQGANPSSISHKAIYTFALNPSNNYSLSMVTQGIPITLAGTVIPGMYSYHAVSGLQLSTYDADHDTHGTLNCATQYGNAAWWYGACWNGSFWGGGDSGGYQNAAYWAGSAAEYFAWGAIWLREFPVPITKSDEANVKVEGAGSLKFNAGSQQVDSNTVGLWHLDETGGTGAYLKDSTANANNGTPTGTTVVEGKYNNARSFDGSSDAISLGNPSSLQMTGNQTIEMWLYPTDMSVRRNPFAKAYGGEGTITQEIAGTLSYYYGTAGGDGSPYQSFSSVASIPLNQWSHIALVRNLNDMQLYWYINGTLTNQAAATYSSAVASSLTAYIGDGYTNNYAGKIDEVRFSSVARSPEEIAESYRMGRDHKISRTISSADLSSSTKLPFYVASDRLGTFLQMSYGESAFANYEPDANTVGLWHLDEQAGAGAYFKDSSRNGNNGTPTGTTLTQGKIGKAQYFNGSSNYISYSSQVIPLGAKTFSAWVKTTTTNGPIMDNNGGSSTYHGTYIGTDANGKLWLINGKGTSGTLRFSVISNTSINDNNFHHVAFTWDGTTNSNAVKIYIDGKFDGQGTAVATETTAATYSLLIGKQNAYAAYYTGIIDEVRFDSVARTSDEIRQTYEVGSRTHDVTIDFKAKLGAGNLITGSGDLGFTVDETAYGSTFMASHIFLGEKIIVKENYNGTEYIAQGTVNAVNMSTGAVNVVSWDTGSTFPSGGFTVNATVFKWQREYFDLTGSLSSQRDAATRLTYRITDGSQGANIWLDDIRSSTGYLNTPGGSTITSSTGKRYFQYRAIQTSTDYDVSASLTSLTLDYTINTAPNTPTLDAPTDTATNQSLTPQLKTTATDNDSDNIQYKIIMCKDSGMSVSCQTFDQTSSQTGWSGQNADGNTTYTSGTQGTYLVQSALETGTTYYWKSYAIDPAGINTWSATQASPYSFTTTNIPSAPTLLLTEGATNPTNVASLTPYFSAIHNDTDGDSANFYQILVNTASDFSGTSMWDSGKVSMTLTANGGRSPNITYAGSPLAWSGTYYWKIKFWDTFGAEGTYSSFASFTLNTTPGTPTLDEPTNGATEQALSPSLKTTATDTDSDNLQYKIDICKDLVMTTSCQTFDQTSSQTGWSGQNADGNTTYTSGTQGTYTIQTSLDINTTYYWRSYAIDPAGTNTWSPTQTTPYSFTTTSAPLAATNCRVQEDFANNILTVIWTDNATNEDKYEVQRSLDGAAFSVLHTNLAANTTSDADNSMSLGHTYQYRVAPYFSIGPTYGGWCTTQILSLQSGIFSNSGVDLKGLILR